MTAATQELAALLARVDHAASRFRVDSALSMANARAGRPTSGVCDVTTLAID